MERFTSLGRRTGRQALLAAFGVSILAAAPSTLAAQADVRPDASAQVPVQSGLAADRALATKRLCQNIRAAVAKLPKTASVEDLEAAIVFVLSQAKAEREVADAALQCAGSGSDGNLRTAIANARRSFGGSVGTGAIGRGSGGNGGSGGSFLSAPIVGVGGGSSNYSSTR